jgi:hypothetical protein
MARISKDKFYHPAEAAKLVGVPESVLNAIAADNRMTQDAAGYPGARLIEMRDVVREGVVPGKRYTTADAALFLQVIPRRVRAICSSLGLGERHGHTLLMTGKDILRAQGRLRTYGDRRPEKRKGKRRIPA